MRRTSVMIAAVLLAGACRPEGVTVLSESELPSEVYGSPRPTPSPSPQEIPDEGTVFLVKDGRLHPQIETLQPLETPQEALLIALLAAQPQGRGVISEIPRRTRLNEVEVDGTVATVDLSTEFEQGTGQSLALRLAQVVYTLTQQPGIVGVRFEIDGAPEPVFDPDHPASRGDFREFAPQGTE
jgi:sporulation and spore germination protein